MLGNNVQLIYINVKERYPWMVELILYYGSIIKYASNFCLTFFFFHKCIVIVFSN